MNDMPELPAVAEIPMPEPDYTKEAAVRAAMHYEYVEKERQDQRRLLEQAKTAIEIKDHQIAMLQTELAVERNRYDSLQNCYLEAVQDKSDLEAVLAGERDAHEDRAARLARFEFSRLRKRTNGKKRNGTSEPVPESLGGEGEMAGLASMVAARTGRSEVLERREEED